MPLLFVTLDEYMSEKVELNGDYCALGIPENAMDFTVYGLSEMHEFLGAAESRIKTDCENEERFLMFYNSVDSLKEAIELIAENRKTLMKIFSPEDILNMDDLGYWRILYKTTNSLQIPLEKAKKKVTSKIHGPHYSVEERDLDSIIRAKGNSFHQAESLFMEAVEYVIV